MKDVNKNQDLVIYVYMNSVWWQSGDYKMDMMARSLSIAWVDIAASFSSRVIINLFLSEMYAEESLICCSNRFILSAKVASYDITHP